MNISHMVQTLVFHLLSLISPGLGFWSVNQISVLENSDIKVIEDTDINSFISSSCLKYVFAKNVYKNS